MSEDITRPIFHPGHFVKQQLDQRGWTQADLAMVLDRPLQVVNELIAGKRAVTPETAVGLANAFGSTVDYWLNLQAKYQASLLEKDPGVARRARILSMGPIQEMTRRKWISGSRDADQLERQVVFFYSLKDIDENPAFDFAAARKSASYEFTSLPLVAWLHRCRQIARELIPTGSFSNPALDEAITRLRDCFADPDGVKLVPSILSDAGIRFLVVEHLTGTRVDGACFWLEDNAPAIALSMRYERIDYFWHTLLHELAHVRARDGLDRDNGRVDVDLPGTRTPIMEERPASEVEADRFASETLINPELLQAFIRQNRPMYSRRKIIEFARILGVHPGILVGQLQYRGEILYSHSRDLLVSVRGSITTSARTDGWNKSKRSA